MEILEVLSQRYSNRKIASKFEISTNTFKFHLKNLYEKIQVDSRTQAVAFYNKLFKEEEWLIHLFCCKFIDAPVFYKGEDLPPHLLFGDSGQTIEETNKLLSVALTAVCFEVLGQ